jgi:6-hydroxymethylpterin diphosphokinase MptE-like
VSLVKKIKNKIIFFFIKEKVLYKENVELKNRFNHFKQCYILGTGPSINKLNLKFNENDLIISMGNFHEHPDINKIKPHIHVFAASHEPITDAVLKKWWYRADEKLPKDTLILVENRDYVLAKECFKSREVFQYSYGGKFPIDFTKRIISSGSVAQIALQLAMYYKIREINLVGINHDWQRLTPYSHFYSHDKPSLEYYLYDKNIKIHYEERKGHMPKEFLYSDYRLYQGYEKLKVYAEGENINVYNIDPYSSFDVFEKSKVNNII